jgi:hypothetical protein
MKLEFSRQFSKNREIINFMKTRAVGAELFRADAVTDRRTDMTKLIVAFRNFAKGPTNLQHPRALRGVFWQSLPLVNTSLSRHNFSLSPTSRLPNEPKKWQVSLVKNTTPDL